MAAAAGHVVAVFTRNELAPGRIVVADRPATRPDGSFLRQNIRLSEQIARETPLRGGYRVRTRHTLRPGRDVQVSGVVIGIDCIPVKPCPRRWSNIRPPRRSKDYLNRHHLGGSAGRCSEGWLRIVTAGERPERPRLRCELGEALVGAH